MVEFLETISQIREAGSRNERFIPLHEPMFMGNEKKYLEECVNSTFVSSVGKFVDLFELNVARYVGSKHAIACVNGSCALQMSLQLAGVKAGDEVLVPTLTFIAPVNAITYNGARPVFMDVDKYYNLDVEKTIEFICNETKMVENESRFTVHKKTGKQIAAIVLVHVWGNAVGLDELIPICAERNITVVEDACESLGSVYNEGKYKGRHTGTIGKLGCLSFNGNKIITSGGGGMILTDDDDLAANARYLTTQAKDDPVRYVHHKVGYNFRLSNIQAALGVAQLEQLPSFLKRKREIFLRYQSALQEIKGIVLADVPDYANNNHWMNVMQIDYEAYGENNETLRLRLGGNGIQARQVWSLNHRQKPYKVCANYKIERAGNLVERSLCLPGSVGLSIEQHEEVIINLRT